MFSSPHAFRARPPQGSLLTPPREPKLLRPFHVVLVLRGSRAPWCYGTRIMRHRGTVASWLHGAMVLLRPGVTAPWSFCTVVLRHSGPAAPLFCCTVVLGHSETVTPKPIVIPMR